MKYIKVACIGLLFGSLSLVAMKVKKSTSANDKTKIQMVVNVSRNEIFEIKFNLNDPNKLTLICSSYCGSVFPYNYELQLIDNNKILKKTDRAETFFIYNNTENKITSLIFKQYKLLFEAVDEKIRKKQQ